MIPGVTQDPDAPKGETSLDVRGAQRGDAAAADRMVRRLSPLIRAAAAYRLRIAGLKGVDPDDLVAEAWAIALPKLDGLGEHQGRRTPVVLAFLTTTIRNLVGKLMRRRAVRGPTASLDGGGPASAAPPEPVASETGVVTGALREERRDLVTAAIERLDDADREILLLRGVEQRGNAEAAELLGLSPSAAAMRFQRALERLRRELPDSVFDEIEGA